MKAIKALLAAECERNKFAIARMLGMLAQTHDAIDTKNDVTIETNETGDRIVSFWMKDGVSSAPLPSIKRDVIDKYLFELASIDKPMFDRGLSVSENLSEAEHVFRSFRVHVAEQNEPMGGHLESFCGYGQRELSEVDKDVAELYKACTGKKIVSARVR